MIFFHMKQSELYQKRQRANGGGGGVVLIGIDDDKNILNLYIGSQQKFIFFITKVYYILRVCINGYSEHSYKKKSM